MCNEYGFASAKTHASNYRAGFALYAGTTNWKFIFCAECPLFSDTVTFMPNLKLVLHGVQGYLDKQPVTYPPCVAPIYFGSSSGQKSAICPYVDGDAASFTGLLERTYMEK